MFYSEIYSKEDNIKLDIPIALVDKEYLQSLDSNLVLRVVNSVAGGRDQTTFYISDIAILSGVVSILTKYRYDSAYYKIYTHDSPEYARPFPMYIVFDNKASLTKYKLRS